MISFSRALGAGALLATAAQATDHFIQTQVRTLEYSRVDPLVTPNANAEHVHTVVGGSAFGPGSTTHDSLVNSRCSSSSLQDDKSAYWSPSLYYVHANGSFSLIPSSTRIYYFLKPGNGTIPVKPFPKGLRMLAGPPSNKRANPPPPRGKLSYEQLQAMDPRVAAIKWGCSAGAVQGQGNGGSLDGQRPYLPNDAPNGCGVVNAGIFYPSCSDGRLDSPDHFDHMRYPLDGSNGYNCPPTHPIKYPTIFMEHFYFPKADQPYRGANQGNWILSSGDRIGTSFHADFIEGWANNALDDALAYCNTPNAPGDNLAACSALGKSVSVDAADNCRSEGNIVNEDVGLITAIDKLPGCNVWPDDQDTHPGCKSDQVPMGQPASRYVLDEFKLALPIAAVEGSGAHAKAAPPPSASTSAPATTSAATTTSSQAPATSASSSAPYTEDYNYGVAPPAGSTSTSRSSSAAPTSSSADYNYGAAPPAGTTSSSSSYSGSSSSAAPTSPSSPGHNAPAPGGNSNPSTTTRPATSITVSTSSASTSPTSPAQLNGPAPPKTGGKTCRPKRKGKKHHHQRRSRQNRLIN